MDTIGTGKKCPLPRGVRYIEVLTFFAQIIFSDHMCTMLALPVTPISFTLHTGLLF